MISECLNLKHIQDGLLRMDNLWTTDMPHKNDDGSVDTVLL